METNRILELAIQELESRRAKLSAEIETLRSELKGTAAQPAKKAAKFAAIRKAQSLRMKNYWAAKRAKAAKTKRRTKTAAEKKALSRKMKEIWKKRKASAAKKS